jgi:glycerophosphoryl diester phosphodiesterase
MASSRVGGCRFDFLDHPEPIAFAHRGGAAESPENTWSAFEHALRLGYRYLETDVHATADDVVVLLHDAVLDRVSDGTGPVRSRLWSDLRHVRMPDGRPVPRLDEVLEEWPSARWNIDAKHDGVVKPLIQTLGRSRARSRVCVTSFSDRRLVQVRRALGPALCTAAGPNQVTALRGASLLPPFAPLGPIGTNLRGLGAVQVPRGYGRLPLVDHRFVTTAHRLGLEVHVWTIDDEATMGRLLDLGVDGIMTDRPSALKAVLQARGQWAEGEDPFP